LTGDIFSKTAVQDDTFWTDFSGDICGEFVKLSGNVFGVFCAVVLAGLVGENCCLFFVGEIFSTFWGLFVSSPGSLGVSQPEFWSSSSSVWSNSSENSFPA
jgi:hypothetical protein